MTNEIFWFCAFCVGLSIVGASVDKPSVRIAAGVLMMAVAIVAQSVGWRVID